MACVFRRQTDEVSCMRGYITEAECDRWGLAAAGLWRPSDGRVSWRTYDTSS